MYTREGYIMCIVRECEFSYGGYKYYGLNVNGTKYAITVGQYENYIKNPDLDILEKIEGWVDTRLMPYMTRKSINYKGYDSYVLKHIAEEELGPAVNGYVSNEEIKYILAMKGIKGKAKAMGNSTLDRYPINLNYPLNNEFKK